jgi:hypothetical protein
MNIRAKTLLYDVLESGRCIRDWCVGHSFADYEANRQFRRAVEASLRSLERRSIAFAALIPPLLIASQNWIASLASATTSSTVMAL